MHDTLTIGIPLLAILFGILWNQQGLRDLRNDMTGMRNEMIGRFGNTDSRIDRLQSDVNGRLDRMQADLSQFYRTLGQHEARIDTLEKQQ